MKKIIFLFIFLNHCSAFSQPSTNKKYMASKSALTSVGSSTIYNNNYSILQSIGQLSIIGEKKLNLTSVQQGFLTYTHFLKIDNSLQETFDFVISPNPFMDYLKIEFSKKTTYQVDLKIYDITGKTLVSLQFPPTKNITIPLEKFNIGNYLIQIRSGNKSITKEILKIE